MRRQRFQTAVAAVVVAIGGTAVMAAPKPMILSATYDDSVSSDLKLPKDLKPCQLRVTALVDERRSPEMIGVYFNRAIHAPEDREAWMRSIITSLKSRKIAVDFSGVEEDGGVATIPADIAITKAWIANTESNMSASIVLRVKTTDAAGAVAEQSYRGGASHMSYFSGGPGGLQRAFDTAVSRALDAVSADLHKRCSGS